MAPRSDSQTVATGSGVSDGSDQSSIDPIFHLLRILPFSFLRPPRLRLKIPSFTLPSPMTVYALILLTYFLVVSGFVYDVIVEPPGIGSTQDPVTGTIRPVVFMSGRVNGQYIIEGLSSGFMFVLGGIGIVMLDLALDKNKAKSVKASYAVAGVSSIVIGYVMSFWRKQTTGREHSRIPRRSKTVNGTVLRHDEPFSLLSVPAS
ncbi:PREDICTED: oligosaccharyltransferase complex subunit ostc-like [Camelina sativa]|uniref:Oligosaccharyltransferase complex subunit ostc-like n=1 Tax=Camelina sativa TaxID=90675 RepID=A0ABM0SRW8_CAMSA|nr:PREDICTED: oligosaccharyltransferase complex subunit ostc-like [Camelina sativa]